MHTIEELKHEVVAVVVAISCWHQGHQEGRSPEKLSPCSLAWSMEAATAPCEAKMLA